MKSCKKFAILLITVFLLVFLFETKFVNATNSFGYDTIGGSSAVISSSAHEYIIGSVFTCPSDVVANNICVALKRTVAGYNLVTAAIYKHSDLSLVGQTVQFNMYFNTTFRWTGETAAGVFNDPKPTLFAGTEYVLQVWADYTDSAISLAYTAGSTDQGHQQDLAYTELFPNPLVPTHNNNMYSIYCNYTLLNTPTNDDLTLDLSGASYKGTKTLLTGKQDYKFVYKCSDADGVTNITYAEIRLDYATKNVILRATRGSGDAWTFSEQSDPTNYVTLNMGGSSHSTSGNQKTFNYLVTINWNWDDVGETLGVRCYVIDSLGLSDQDDYTNIFGVENDLSSSSLSVNDYRCNPSQTLTFSGYWYYEGTSIYPPNGDYQVKIKLSSVQKGSTDTTLVSGAFSISDVTAESTVNSYSYTVEATYMSGAGSFSAVIVDKIKVSSYTVSDSRANINDNINIDATLVYEYGSTAVTTGTITINGYSASHQGSGVYRITRTSSSVTDVTYNTVAGSESTYGLNTVNQNSQSTTVIWDRLQVQSYTRSDDRVDVNVNVNVDVLIWFDYSDTACTTATITINGYSASHIGSGVYRITRTSASVTSITYDTVACSAESSYGITTVDQNSKSTSVIWDRIEVYEKDDPTIGSTFSATELVYSSDPIVGPQNWYALISSMFVPLLFLALLINKLPRRFRVPKPKREWLTLLFLILLFCSCFLLCFNNVPSVKANPGIVRVQGNARGTSTTSSISVTMSSTPTSGNALVATIATVASPVRTVSSISQTGVTWTYQIAITNGLTRSEIWYGVVGSGASKSITITLSGTPSYAVADVCEYSGLLTSGFLDKTATASESSGYPSTGTTATTTQADELWIGCTAIRSASQSTPTNGFTLLDGATGTVGVAYLEKIVSSTGTANSGTTASASNEWAGCIATFKATLANQNPTAPTSLLCEGSTNATAVIDTTPEFSAIFNDPDTSETSNAFEVHVATTSAGLDSPNMWDSGWLADSTSKGDRCADKSYAGTTLTLNGLTYYWKCRFRDDENAEGAWSAVQQFTMKDEQTPTYSNTGYNTTVAGNPCLFSCYWQDNIGLSGFKFSTNNTGSWVNDTWTDPWSGTPTSGWANVTKTLSTSVSIIIGYRWYCNDTSNNWNNTGILTLTTTYSAAPQYSSIAHNTTISNSNCEFSCYWTDDQALSGYKFGTNNTGSWINETWASLSGKTSWANVSKTLTLSVGVRVEYRWWCNDSQGQWSDTGIQFLITTNPTAPTYSNIATNTTIAGATCLFSCYWQDNVQLSGYIFSTNNTGSWVNDMWTSLSGSASWANKTKTLNIIIHITIGYRWYCNDTGDNWADTGIQTIYLISQKSISVPTGTYVIIWFKARYDYDDVAYTSQSGSTLSINGTLATYDSQAGYWWINVTQNTQGNYTYIVSAASDGVYGLTAIYNAAGSVTIEWYSPNNLPVNDACTPLDLEASSTVYARYKYYSFEVNVTHAPLSDQMDYIEIRFEYSEGNYWIIIRWVNSTDSFSVINGTEYINENGSTRSTDVNRTILTFKLRFDWDYPLTSDVDAQVYSRDTLSGSDLDSYNLNITLVNTLTVSGFACNDDRGNIQQTITFSGTVYYSGTSVSPPDVAIVAIQIHDSSHNKLGEAATISGVFSVSGTAKPIAQSTTYHPYVNGTDQDIGVTKAFITDSLITFNLQTIQYLGDGEYQYKTQIKYAFDSNLIDGAFVNVSLPTGNSIGQLTSNSTGWVTFSLGQGNATAGGSYKIFGTSDVLYGVTVAGSNQTFVLRSWTLVAKDTEGNSLTNTNKTVSKASTSVWSGTASAIRIPEDTFNVTVTWLQNLQVNATTNIVISGDTTSNLTCTAYPYVISTRYWVVSNATIASMAYASNMLTVSFSGPVDTYILVTDYPTQPSYILNFTYDYDVVFAPYSYLVLPHYANTTININYEAWGGVNVYKTDRNMTDCSWSGQKLSLTFSGQTGQTGNVEVYCSSRGAPADYASFTTGLYSSSTKIFTGTYAFTSFKTVTLNWETTGSSPSGGPSGPGTFGNLLVAVDFFFAPKMRVGTSVPGTISVTWSGPISIYVYDVKFGNMTWFTLEGLPLKLMKERSLSQGNATLEVTVNIPFDATAGKYSLPCVVTFQTETGQEVTVGGTLQFEILAAPTTIPQYMTILMLGVIASILFTAMFRRRRTA